MRSLEELVNVPESALPLVAEWIAAAVVPCEMLPPSPQNGDVLLRLQVTTRSPLGAIAYSTGGVLVDHGYLRILGSGHPKLARNIVDWNEERSSGFLLVADDAVGGFFAINGGGLGTDVKSMFYLAPDTLAWEALGMGYSDFLVWAFSERLQQFYSSLRWPGWEADIQGLEPSKCFSFYPFLCTEEGSVLRSSRRAISVSEVYALSCDLQTQLHRGGKTQRFDPPSPS